MLLVGEAAPSLSRLKHAVEASEGWRVIQAPAADAGLGLLRSRPADLVVASLGDESKAYGGFFRDVLPVAPGAIRVALLDDSAQPTRVEHAHQTLAVREDMSYLLPCLRSAANVASVAGGRGGPSGASRAPASSCWGRPTGSWRARARPCRTRAGSGRAP